MEMYKKFKVPELREIAENLSLNEHRFLSKMRKKELISFILSDDECSSEYRPKSKYFSFLSGLTDEELCDIMCENMVHYNFPIKRAGLIELLDEQCACEDWKYVREPMIRRMFPDTLRAWVDLFVSDKSVAEHYSQIILHVLSSAN